MRRRTDVGGGGGGGGGVELIDFTRRRRCLRRRPNGMDFEFFLYHGKRPCFGISLERTYANELAR